VTTLQALPEPRTAPAPAVLVRPARYEPEPGAVHPPPPAGSLRHAPPDPDVSRAQLAEAHRHIVPVLRLALEVLDGRRAAEHLGGLTSPEVLRYWRAARGQRRARTPARLTGLRVCLPMPGTAEVAAVCAIDGRVRALATRFERRAGRWQCTAVRLG
jgi:Family of unknown function (DUF6459)